MITLSIGKSTYDITIPVDEYPIENQKYILKEKLEGSGGSASNVAYLLGKWNMDSYYAGVVGYDDLGTNIKKELEANKVHTNFMEINYEKKTTMSMILANKATTSRTQFVIEPETYHLKKTDFDVAPNVIYSDGYEYSATNAAFNKFQNAISILGAGVGSADEKEVVALAKYARYVIFSLEFACHATKMKVDPTNPTHLLNLYKEVKSKFPNSINIITLHSAGVLYEINNEVKVMPPLQVSEVDRTGAGDTFDGAMIYALGNGYDLEKCIRFSSIAGALSTTKYGAKNSIPLLSDVIQKYEEKFGPLSAPEIPVQNPAPTQAPQTPPVAQPQNATPAPVQTMVAQPQSEATPQA